jgi:hypothetical protein
MFPIVQIIYWLALATWFGGVLFVAIAAPIIFRTVREWKPTLPTVLSVNLENQHADLLAGSIVGNILATLGRVELACAAGMFLGLLGQWILADRGSPGALTQIILRSALFAGATALLLYDWLVVTPRIQRYRDEYVEHADEPDVANAAKDQFDRYHRESVNVLTIVLLLLLGLVLFSGHITTSAISVNIPR